MHIEKMEEKHLDQIVRLEEECFAVPWSKNSFLGELKNKLAVYLVAVEDGNAVGYAGMWHVVNEGHITNVAVSPKHRGKHIGSALMEALVEEGKSREMLGITLEVRKSNAAAIGLYKKYGFKLEGIRKEYYEDNREDALIMWKYFVDEEKITFAGQK